MGRTRTFRLADVLSIVEGVPLGMRAVFSGFDLHFVYDNTLLWHLCGTVHPLEYGLAMRKADAELRIQLPWLAGECPPEGVLGLDDWAFNWAWLDTMERRYGSEHPVRPLPAQWRSTVPLSDFEAYDEDEQQVGFLELPEELQAILKQLGYKN